MSEKRCPKVLIFASGTKDGGGSVFQSLALARKRGWFQADITAVVSNHQRGGVRKIAEEFYIPFLYFPVQYPVGYSCAVRDTNSEWVLFSGWIRKSYNLDPQKTINIHPARLEFGGSGMYGLAVHRAVLEAYHAGLITNTASTMHFVTDEYDKGPAFFECPVPIFPNDTPEVLEERVKKIERLFYWVIADMVFSGKISWDGKNHDSLVLPKHYLFSPKK